MKQIVTIVAGLLMMTIPTCSSSKKRNSEFVKDVREITVFDSAGNQG